MLAQGLLDNVYVNIQNVAVPKSGIALLRDAVRVHIAISKRCMSTYNNWFPLKLMRGVRY